VHDHSSVHAGVALLAGDPEPDSLANLAVIHNPTYVWPDSYVLDADKIAFLTAADSAHSAPASGSVPPHDYSVIVSAGPFSLAPGDSNEVAFVIAGALSVSALQTSVDRAQDLYAPAAVAVGSPPAPAPTRLLAAVPNPFRGRTAVRYELGARSAVRISVFDIGGRRVLDLVRGVQEAGVHAVRWEGMDQRGRPVGSGVYFIRFQSPDVVQSRSVTVVW
jgi:hypothetical protein